MKKMHAMTNKEEYEYLIRRVSLPENREIHAKCLNHPDDKDRELADLFDKVRDNFKHLENANNMDSLEADIEKKLCKIKSILNEKGAADMQARLNKLGLLLKEAGRSDYYFRSMEDIAYQKQLLEEFGL